MRGFLFLGLLAAVAATLFTMPSAQFEAMREQMARLVPDGVHDGAPVVAERAERVRGGSSESVDPKVASWSRQVPERMKPSAITEQGRATGSPVSVTLPKRAGGSLKPLRPVEVQAVEAVSPGVVPKRVSAVPTSRIVDVVPAQQGLGSKRVSLVGSEQISVVELRDDRQERPVDLDATRPIEAPATARLVSPEVPTGQTANARTSVEANRRVSSPPVTRRAKKSDLRRRSRARRRLEAKRRSRLKRRAAVRRNSRRTRRYARSRYRTRRSVIGRRGLVRVKRKCFRQRGCDTVVTFRRPRTRNEAREISRIRNRIMADRIRRARRYRRF